MSNQNNGNNGDTLIIGIIALAAFVAFVIYSVNEWLIENAGIGLLGLAAFIVAAAIVSVVAAFFRVHLGFELFSLTLGWFLSLLLMLRAILINQFEQDDWMFKTEPWYYDWEIGAWLVAAVLVSLTLSFMFGRTRYY